jgi:hypothetical protein
MFLRTGLHEGKASFAALLQCYSTLPDAVTASVITLGNHVRTRMAVLRLLP